MNKLLEAYKLLIESYFLNEEEKDFFLRHNGCATAGNDSSVCYECKLRAEEDEKK